MSAKIRDSIESMHQSGQHEAAPVDSVQQNVPDASPPSSASAAAATSRAMAAGSSGGGGPSAAIASAAMTCDLCVQRLESIDCKVVGTVQGSACSMQALLAVFISDGAMYCNGRCVIVSINRSAAFNVGRGSQIWLIGIPFPSDRPTTTVDRCWCVTGAAGFHPSIHVRVLHIPPSSSTFEMDQAIDLTTRRLIRPLRPSIAHRKMLGYSTLLLRQAAAATSPHGCGPRRLVAADAARRHRSTAMAAACFNTTPAAANPSPAALRQMRALSSWWGGRGGGNSSSSNSKDGGGGKNGDGKGGGGGRGGDKPGGGEEPVVVVENKGSKDHNNHNNDALTKFGGGDCAPRHPHVLALPILRRPFFPGLVQAVNITSPKVFEAISAIKNDYGHYYLGT